MLVLHVDDEAAAAAVALQEIYVFAQNLDTADARPLQINNNTNNNPVPMLKMTTARSQHRHVQKVSRGARSSSRIQKQKTTISRVKLKESRRERGVKVDRMHPKGFCTANIPTYNSFCVALFFFEPHPLPFMFCI